MSDKDFQKIALYLLGASIAFLMAGFMVSLLSAMSSCW